MTKISSKSLLLFMAMGLVSGLLSRFKRRLIANFGSLSVLLLWHHLFPF